MKWRRLSAEAITNGPYIISRTRHTIKAQTFEHYTLYRGAERVGIYDSADEAKQAARGQG